MTTSRPTLTRRRWRRLGPAAGRQVLLMLVSLIMLTPVVWVILSSLKPVGEVMYWPPTLFGSSITLESYREVLDLLPIGRFYLNSIILAVISVVSNVVFCTLAGYVLARMRFRGRKALLFLVIAGMMIPIYVRLIPIYSITASTLGLSDTYLGIALPGAVHAFGIFLMRQFFVGSIPVELEEAARVDGCTDWGVVFRIVVPIAKPAIATLALFAVSWSIEDFLWPLVITNTTDMRPIQVGLAMAVSDKTIVWGPVTAMLTLTIVPVVFIFSFLQKYFVAGMTAGAVKE